MNKQEMVNHPLHYGGADNPYEAIKVIEAWEADFNIGTTLRYLCRCGKKTIGGSAEEMRLEDLKKYVDIFSIFLLFLIHLFYIGEYLILYQ